METKQATSPAIDAMAVLSLACAVLAAAGLYVMGMAVLAVFAVGAGHVALERIRRRGGRGKLAAMIGLAIGYAIGVFGLAGSLWSVASLMGQYN